MISMKQYITVPADGVSRSVALGISLLSAVPPEASAPVIHAAEDVRDATVTLQSDWAMRLKDQSEAVDPRPFDHEADLSWRGFHTALQGAATLKRGPRAEGAELVLRQVFPDGRSFLTLGYRQQWAEAERRLQLIETEGLEPAIVDATGGPEFLDRVRTEHAAYGRALKITDPAPTDLDVDLGDGVKALRDAIGAYMLQLVAWGNQDAANEVAAATALQPVEVARAAWATRRSTAEANDEPEVTPETPVPNVV